MSAYGKTYLFDAMEMLGEAFDYAENAAGLGAQTFFDLFVSTGVAEAFGSGAPRYVAGMSGIELVLSVCDAAGMDVDQFPRAVHAPLGRSPAYWSGWSLAFFQWKTERSFANIGLLISVEEIAELYDPLHEASEEKFVDVLEARITRKALPTRLKVIREARGLSQIELAEASGVSLRAIQQYEQRRKDIDKAQARSVLRLARVLGCTIEDLLEYTPDSECSSWVTRSP